MALTIVRVVRRVPSGYQKYARFIALHAGLGKKRRAMAAVKGTGMPLTGGCECGSVNYSIKTGNVHVYVCHCRNCQRRSGSAFAEHAMVQAGTFVLEGETAEYRRSANGIQFEEIFCRTCHTRIFNRNDVIPHMIFIRAGTLSTSQDLRPVAHIWTSRKQTWILLPEGVARFEQSPTPEEFNAVIEVENRRISTQ